MKKMLTMLLAAAIALSTVTACGGNEKSGGKKSNSVFDISKEAYEEIKNAYTITDKISGDVYEAWRAGIYDDDEMSVEFLASETNLSEDELVAGFNAFMNDSDKTEKDLDFIFSKYDDLDLSLPLWQLCVLIVTNAYEENGMAEEARVALENAKTHMKTLSEKHSDYEHYPSLKGYYTTTNSYFNFCTNPEGSFEQLKTTINDYRNDARDYVADIEFIFEE